MFENVQEHRDHRSTSGLVGEVTEFAECMASLGGCVTELPIHGVRGGRGLEEREEEREEERKEEREKERKKAMVLC